LVILLSAFNGIESMIEKMYSDFDSDITIRSAHGKTFSENEIDQHALRKIQGVVNISRAIEEVVVLKHEKKWVNAQLIGVDTNFLSMSQMSQHVLEGDAFLVRDGQSFGICGAGLLDKLNGFIPQRMGYEQLIVYSPKRDAKMRLGASPFRTNLLNISARMNFNKEVNTDKLIVPISFAKDALSYDNDITAIYIDVNPSISNDEIKEAIAKKIGTEFNVKTSYEKNELIYQTSKSEKLIVFIILIFIFILASFNLIASLTMLFVEKKNNVQTLISFGANNQTILSIFLFEGLLIAGKGILIGLILGYGISFLQINLGFVTLPNSGGEPFPMKLNWGDSILICITISTLSFVFSYLPVRYLVRRNFGHLRF
jgi:lipoprotein-releasing system permease protein